MNNIGFLISEKENEKRRALIFEDIKKIKNKKNLFFQKGYGNVLGIEDIEFEKIGCNVVDKEKVLNCDIICDPKIGDEECLKKIKNRKIFGWIHATQNYSITQILINNRITAIAWEKMYDNNRHIFDKNNQIAGKAAVLHAILCYGEGIENKNVAILGNGNTAKGAIEIAKLLNANVEVFARKNEKEFIRRMKNFDVIINCILWDVTRKDHIIYRGDLKKLKKGTMIIDVSCDKNGAIETTIPTTIEKPIYYIDEIMHYAVDHTPSLLHREASKSISVEVSKYIDDLIFDKNNNILENAIIIKDGRIIDDEINKFQRR